MKGTIESLDGHTYFIFLLKCHLTSSLSDCRDTYRESPYCDAWKSKGFCKQYKDQLDTYCPKTCGFCISKYNWYFSPEKLTLTHKQHFMSHTRPRCNRKSEWLTVELILFLFYFLFSQSRCKVRRNHSAASEHNSSYTVPERYTSKFRSREGKTSYDGS